MPITNFFEDLHQSMTNRAFLKSNPVLARVNSGELSVEQSAEVLRQYVRFPEEIVQMLQGAATRFIKGSPIVEELERNWGQENGSATGGVPHVEVLKHALKRDLAINADHVKGSPATERFISSVLDGMKRESPWFALGQAYALESSAVPELAILVGPFVNTYADMTGKPQPIRKIALKEMEPMQLVKIRTAKEAYDMDMSQWFALHIKDFEVGHRDFLRERAGDALENGGDRAAFKRGFDHVMDTMDDWWIGLAAGK